MTSEQIANIIASKRKQMGMSQKELASKTGLTQATISSIESCNTEMLLPTAIKLLSAVGMQLTAIQAFKEQK